MSARFARLAALACVLVALVLIVRPWRHDPAPLLESLPMILTTDGQTLRCVRITLLGGRATAAYVVRDTQDWWSPPPGPQVICEHGDGTFSAVRPSDVRTIENAR